MSQKGKTSGSKRPKRANSDGRSEGFKKTLSDFMEEWSDAINPTLNHYFLDKIIKLEVMCSDECITTMSVSKVFKMIAEFIGKSYSELNRAVAHEKHAIRAGWKNGSAPEPTENPTPSRQSPRKTKNSKTPAGTRSIKSHFSSSTRKSPRKAIQSLVEPKTEPEEENSKHGPIPQMATLKVRRLILEFKSIFEPCEENETEPLCKEELEILFKIRRHAKKEGLSDIHIDEIFSYLAKYCEMSFLTLSNYVSSFGSELKHAHTILPPRLKAKVEEFKKLSASLTPNPNEMIEGIHYNQLDYLKDYTVGKPVTITFSFKNHSISNTYLLYEYFRLEQFCRSNEFERYKVAVLVVIAKSLNISLGTLKFAMKQKRKIREESASSEFEQPPNDESNDDIAQPLENHIHDQEESEIRSFDDDNYGHYDDDQPDGVDTYLSTFVNNFKALAGGNLSSAREEAFEYLAREVSVILDDEDRRNLYDYLAGIVGCSVMTFQRRVNAITMRDQNQRNEEERQGNSFIPNTSYSTWAPTPMHMYKTNRNVQLQEENSRSFKRRNEDEAPADSRATMSRQEYERSLMPMPKIICIKTEPSSGIQEKPPHRIEIAQPASPPANMRSSPESARFGNGQRFEMHPADHRRAETSSVVSFAHSESRMILDIQNIMHNIQLLRPSWSEAQIKCARSWLMAVQHVPNISRDELSGFISKLTTARVPEDILQTHRSLMESAIRCGLEVD